MDVGDEGGLDDWRAAVMDASFSLRFVTYHRPVSSCSVLRSGEMESHNHPSWTPCSSSYSNRDRSRRIDVLEMYEVRRTPNEVLAQPPPPIPLPLAHSRSSLSRISSSR